MDFNPIYKTYKDDIVKLCKSIENNIGNHRIEQDDLFQEASIKLWQLTQDNIYINNKSKVLISIKNHLLDYIKSFKKDALYNAVSIEEVDSTRRVGRVGG